MKEIFSNLEPVINQLCSINPKMPVMTLKIRLHPNNMFGVATEDGLVLHLARTAVLRVVIQNILMPIFKTQKQLHIFQHLEKMQR